MIFSQFFSILAAILVIGTYVRYGYQIHKKSSNPNLITLFLWLTEGVINAFTYWGSFNEIWQALTAIITPFLALGIFLLSIYKRNFSKIRTVEILSLALAIILGFFWQISGNDRLSNILIQSVYVISFFPVGIGIRRGAKEHPMAWNLAVASYVFAILSVLSNYNGDLVSLLYYLVNLVGNIFIIFLIYRPPKKVE